MEKERIEEQRKIFTLEEVTKRTTNDFRDKDYYDAGNTATSFVASYHQLKELYPDQLDKVIKSAVEKYGMFDLDDINFKAIDSDVYNYLCEIAGKVKRTVKAREFTEEEKQLVDPLQVIMDTLDPGMFTVVDMVAKDNSGDFICSKNKPGKSNLVDKINELKSKNFNCKISSKELIISINENGAEELLEFIATFLAEAASKVEPSGADNNSYDLEAIAAQYETSIDDLKEKLKSPEGQQWIMNRMAEIAKENASDPVVQALKTKPDEVVKLTDEEAVKISNELIEKNDALKAIDESFRAAQVVPVFSKGIQGLTKATLFFNNEKKGEVAFDVKNAILGPDVKWSPIVPESPEEALDAPWFMVGDQNTWNLLHAFIFGEFSIEQLGHYNGSGRLYSNDYRNLNNHINMNEVFKSKLIEGKDSQEKDQFFMKLKELSTTTIFDECSQAENGSYFRLLSYTSPDNFELISDGRTKNWLNENKPIEVKKAFKISCKGGHWFKDNTKVAQSDKKKKEAPKAAEKEKISATA